jgi:hypothetical protein
MKFSSKVTNYLLAAAGSVSLMAVATPASAATLAVFGNNAIAGLYSGGGNSVTLVSDADLATAGFLNGFDAFVYTRDGYSFGNSLSAAAAANVKSYVTGNVVLLNGDFADDIGTSQTDQLFNQALSYILGGSGHGYLGEFNGSFAAFSSSASYTPIGLVDGSAGPPCNGCGGSDGDILLTAAGAVSPVTAGVPFPYNPGQVEFGSDLTGVNPAKVLAIFDNGNPAIVASSIGEISVSSVPEPSTWAMMLFGFGAIGVSMRRKAKQTLAMRAA